MTWTAKLWVGVVGGVMRAPMRHPLPAWGRTKPIQKTVLLMDMEMEMGTETASHRGPKTMPMMRHLVRCALLHAFIPARRHLFRMLPCPC